MKLPNCEITTEEVKHWQGLHLLHFPLSSCSQKVRILLAEKCLPYQSHPVNLSKNEHTSAWFLGINPRGVVPVLIHDGEVHIESNDILAYLDQQLPSATPSLLPDSDEERLHATDLLRQEDALHQAMRVLTFYYLAPAAVTRKPVNTIQAYTSNGAPNTYRDKQIAWALDYAEHGIPQALLIESVSQFITVFQHLEQRLTETRYLIADRLSCVDIAWFISIHRAVLCGYPLDQHPALQAYYQQLLLRPHFLREVSAGNMPTRIAGWLFRHIRAHTGQRMSDIYRLSLAALPADAQKANMR